MIQKAKTNIFKNTWKIPTVISKGPKITKNNIIAKFNNPEELITRELYTLKYASPQKQDFLTKSDASKIYVNWLTKGIKIDTKNIAINLQLYLKENIYANILVDPFIISTPGTKISKSTIKHLFKGDLGYVNFYIVINTILQFEKDSGQIISDINYPGTCIAPHFSSEHHLFENVLGHKSIQNWTAPIKLFKLLNPFTIENNLRWFIGKENQKRLARAIGIPMSKPFLELISIMNLNKILKYKQTPTYSMIKKSKVIFISTDQLSKRLNMSIGHLLSAGLLDDFIAKIENNIAYFSENDMEYIKENINEIARAHKKSEIKPPIKGTSTPKTEQDKKPEKGAQNRSLYKEYLKPGEISLPQLIKNVDSSVSKLNSALYDKTIKPKRTVYHGKHILQIFDESDVPEINMALKLQDPNVIDIVKYAKLIGCHYTTLLKAIDDNRIAENKYIIAKTKQIYFNIKDLSSFKYRFSPKHNDELDVPEAAKTLGWSIEKLRAYIISGNIPVRRTGPNSYKIFYIKKEDLPKIKLP